MIFLVCLFLSTTLSVKTPGAYTTSFMEKGCDPKYLYSVDHLVPDCIAVGGGSFKYFCDDDPNNKNVTYVAYGNNDCAGAAVKTGHIADEGKCLFGDTLWTCHLNTDFHSTHWDIPLNMSRKDVGSSENPVIGNLFAKYGKCLKMVGQHFHITATCDAKTEMAEFKFYESAACIVPAHTGKMVKGEIYDVSKLLKHLPTMYMKYTGCST